LVAMLRQADSEYLREMDNRTPQRSIRALEVFESTGRPCSYFRKGHAVEGPFEVLGVVLDTDRERLYQRINARVDAMMAAGLLDEVRSLLPYRAKPPLQTVGYAELFDYLDGKCTLEDAVDSIKQHTRRYAKRQLTWFRKHGATVWFAPDDTDGIIAYVSSRIGLM